MKLKTALSLLATTELKELGKLLDAEVFGNQVSIAACYHACIALMRSGAAWTEADLSRILFPDKCPPDNIRYLRTRTSALMRAIEAYLAWKTFQQDPILQASCLVTALNQRGWENAYRNTYDAAVNMIDQAPLRGFGHYAARLGMFEEAITAERPNLALKSGAIFQDALDALEKSYWLKKLSLSAKAISHDRIRQRAHKLYMIRELDQVMHESPLIDEVAVQLAYCTYKMGCLVDVSSDPWFFRAQELFFGHQVASQQRDFAEAQDIFTHLVNYCVLRYNQKSVAFGGELVRLFRRALESGLLLVDDQIEPHAFLNAFSTFMYQGDQEAMAWLMASYGKKIRGDAGLATRHYCTGYMYFWQANYERASEYLMQALHAPPKSKRPQFEMDIRTLLARSLYMQANYFDAEYQSRQILRILLHCGLEKVRIQSIKSFSTFHIALCKAAKSATGKQIYLVTQLVKKVEAAQIPFIASKWVQIELGKLIQKITPPISRMRGNHNQSNLD